MSSLYPPIQPLDQGHLTVSDGHRLYYEQSGALDGKPVVVLHGGPGGGSTPEMRQFFNPHAYRIVIFDQRGCGKSRPHASLDNNTTWDLVQDIERLREHLEIDSWQVFGGSWGSTLSLAYAQTHPDRVSELVLRGIFMLRKSELDWFYQGGTAFLFPDAWESFLAPIPETERSDLIKAYYRRLTSEDPAVRGEAAKAWSQWEGTSLSLLPDPRRVDQFGENEFAAAFARIECHYFINGGFLERESQLIDNIDRIRHIPAVIVQGRYDVVTPMTTAWDLHRAWPEAEFVVVPDAGHAATEPGTAAALVRATDQFKNAWPIVK